MTLPRLMPEAGSRAFADEPPGCRAARRSAMAASGARPADPEGHALPARHARDRRDVVIAGTGECVCAGHRHAVAVGGVRFVQAGVGHRSENSSDDFFAPALFSGPAGAEDTTRKPR